MKSICVFCFLKKRGGFTTITNEGIIEISNDDYLFLTEDLEVLDRATLDKGIKYLVYKKKQRMIDTVRRVMNDELTEYERNIAMDYWCDNLLVEEITEKYNISRSAFYRTVKIIENKINMYLKYVVYYDNDTPPTKGDFLTFLTQKGDFLEN